MRIRLEGTPQECQQATPRLAELSDVVPISDPYPNRGRRRLVRIYLEIRLPAGVRQAGQDGTMGRPRATIQRAGRELPLP